jgi:hypothetical protein
MQRWGFRTHVHSLFLTVTEVKYFRDCQEALDKGVVCSGVYTIKPDHLPPFEVSEIHNKIVQYHYDPECTQIMQSTATYLYKELSEPLNPSQLIVHPL